MCESTCHVRLGYETDVHICDLQATAKKERERLAVKEQIDADAREKQAISDMKVSATSRGYVKKDFVRGCLQIYCLFGICAERGRICKPTSSFPVVIFQPPMLNLVTIYIYVYLYICMCMRGSMDGILKQAEVDREVKSVEEWRSEHVRVPPRIISSDKQDLGMPAPSTPTHLPCRVHKPNHVHTAACHKKTIISIN